MEGKPQSTLAQSFKYAVAGIVSTVRDGRNIKIELGIGAAVLVVSALLSLQPHEWALIIVMIALVLALELANSAVESVVDLMCPEVHPLAKHAKDAMAGAVLIAALASVAVGLIIFISAALRLWGA